MLRFALTMTAALGLGVGAALAQEPRAAVDPAPHAPSAMAALFSTWDTNADGTVSLAEFQAARHPGANGPDPRHTPEHFRELDTNSDGRITPAEFEAHHRAPHAGR